MQPAKSHFTSVLLFLVVLLSGSISVICGTSVFSAGNMENNQADTSEENAILTQMSVAEALYLQGRIVDIQKNTPVQSAVVSTYVKGASRQRISSEEDGLFVIETSPGEIDELTCGARHYARSRFSLPENMHGVWDVWLFLQPGGFVQGNIAEESSGDAVAGAVVIADSITSGRRIGLPNQYTTRSDDEGEYTVSGLPYGEYKLRINPHPVGFTSPLPEEASFRIHTGDTAAEQKFIVQRGTSIEGIVQDTNGQPLKGIEVQVFPVSSSETIVQAPSVLGKVDYETSALKASTGDEGEFHIHGLRYGQEYRVYCQAPSYVRAISDPIVIQPGESSRSMTMTLTPGGSISGHVLLHDMTPLPGVEVYISPEDDHTASNVTPFQTSVYTDKEGMFGFSGLSLGTYTVRVSNGGPSTVVTLDYVEEQINIDLVFPEEFIPPVSDTRGRSIQGQVILSTGKPAAQVVIEAIPRDQEMQSVQGTSSEEGVFVIADLQATVYDLVITSDQGNAQLQGVAPGADPVRVLLSPPNPISGVVQDATGNPVSKCQVRLVRTDKEEALSTVAMALRNIIGDGSPSVETDAEGRFMFPNASSGRYRLEAQHSMSGFGFSSEFTIVESTPVLDIGIQLNTGITFSGHVQDPAGAPAVKAVVRLVQAPQSDAERFLLAYLPVSMQRAIAQVETDTTGTFHIAAVPPGKYALIVTHGSLATHRIENILINDDTMIEEFSVQLHSGGVVQGHVLTAGTPNPAAIVHMIGLTGLLSTRTDENGYFRFRAVPPGVYMVSLIEPDSNPSDPASQLSMSPRVVDIHDGQTIELDIDDSIGVIVRGYVCGMDMNQVVLVSLRHPGGPNPEDLRPMHIEDAIENARYLAALTVADGKGNFVLPAIQPGPYIVDVYSFDMDLENPDLQNMTTAQRTPRARTSLTIGNNPTLLYLSIPPRL